ncbi:hypothetical protein [Methylorubrum thiocyanatum]|uniref:Uncharacterized protein n=1 Tax=Methylorubrum thiocyanatum TaxID=47958 RepID=A0AA40S6P7_9HYPH|nr:hypothetical protein [Methylorubrum thiocyanatum]MBA8915593.1 hypothetical protein [Methylorubrum thiocyanatum]GJE83431.1 hypothetical protein CJNNKLLH_4804 [Methylorubrum thiocyanatum]
MPRRGFTIVLTALALGLIPSAAFAQNVIALNGDGPSASGLLPGRVGDQVILLGPAAGSRAVVAQTLVTPNGTAPVPNVNDCTFIRDPIALRDCINLYEGQRLAPGPRLSEPRTNVVTDERLIDAAGPIPGSAGDPSGGGRDRINPTDLKRSDGAYIEQVTPRR